MVIKVFNKHNLPTLDYHKVKPLQNNLKDLSQENYNKLKRVLTRRGFTTPLFVWRENDNYWLLDGHQRVRVMSQEDMQPYEVPYVEIHADDINDAKAQLLEITSQYGTITQEGFDEFIADLPEAEIMEAVHFDALPLLGNNIDDDGGEIEQATTFQIKVSFDNDEDLLAAQDEIGQIADKYNGRISVNSN